jgi:K+ transporter
MIKYWMETGKITHYRRCVDYFIITFDHNKINEDVITNYVNNIHRNLEFKLTEKENSSISFLVLLIGRDNNNLLMGIYRKPKQTNTTIHFTSNHPLQHILSAYNFYIQVKIMISTPITEKARQQEWDTIYTIAKNNDFPLRIIHNLKNKIVKTKKAVNISAQTQRKTWINFTYHSTLIDKVTNLFKRTNINIAFRASNTIYNQQHDRTTQNKKNPVGYTDYNAKQATSLM